MELYPQSQDFLDGWRQAKKQKIVEQYLNGVTYYDEFLY